MLTIKDDKGFTGALKNYSAAQSRVKLNARALANYAITKFADCGDLGYAQRLYEAIDPKMHNQSGFARWLMAYAPVIMAKKKFIKDKGAQATTLDLEGALKLAFWEFSNKSDDITDYNPKEVAEALDRIVKRFRNTKKYHAKNAGAMKAIEKVEDLALALVTTK